MSRICNLSWDDENYYMVAFDVAANKIKHYRVDKMENISIIDENRIMPDEEFNPAEYSKKVFSMFGGEEEYVTVEFDSSLAGVVIDRFGMDVSMHRKSDTHFTASLKVAVSNQFLSWVMSFGSKAKIVSPRSVVTKFVNLIDETKNVYK